MCKDVQQREMVMNIFKKKEKKIQLFFQTLNMMQTCGRLVLLSSLEKGKS